MALPIADPVERFNAIVQKIKEKNQRLTPLRLAIVKILAHSEGHPSVEKIYRQLHDDFPTMSLATVYKTVSLVKDLGELSELGFSDGSSAMMVTNHIRIRTPYASSAKR